MELDLDENFKKKRLLSFIIVAGYLFLGGCEYAVIFPTAWDYLQTLGVTDEYWLGFTVSGYSFTAAISGVIGGRLADKYINHTKSIVLVSIAIMGLGSFQYTLGLSVWNVLCSRLICGVGTAAGSAMLAEICRTTSIEERTPILAICNATRQLGILVGPGFQLLLSYFHFTIWGQEVTPLNAPGVFMGVLWLLFCVATFFMFYNLTAELRIMEKKKKNAAALPKRERRVTINERKSESSIESSHSSAINYGSIAEATEDEDEDDMQVSISGPMSHEDAVAHAKGGRGRRRRDVSVSERLFNSMAKSGYRPTADADNIQASIHVDTTYKKYMEDFMTDSFILLLSMVFILFFCQVGIETIIPVVTQNYFGYGIYENSLIYMAGGLEALLVFFFVAYISRYVRDTTLQVVGWFLILFALFWLMLVIPTFEQGSMKHTIYFMIGIMLLYLGYPIASVANTGLSSKVLSDETQGLGQGLRRLASYMGLIYGPTWAGATIKQPFLYLGVPIAVMLVNGVMLACSFRNLRKAEDRIKEMTRKRKALQALDEEAALLTHADS